MRVLCDILSSSPVLEFYDVEKHVSIQTDASSKGLGACLLQNNKPVAYASRALSATEQSYAQIEKEMLAVVFGCTKFRPYVYGKQITIESDHKPLEMIFKKPLAQTPMRLQRMLLQLQAYSINLKYVPGKNLIIADALPRAFLTTRCEKDIDMEDDVTVMVSTVIESLPISMGKKRLFQVENEQDQAMVSLKNTIKKGWPSKKNDVSDDIREYWPMRNDIHEI